MPGLLPGEIGPNHRYNRQWYDDQDHPRQFGATVLPQWDTQSFKIQTFSFHSLKYYSQISPLILLMYYDDAACVLRKMCLHAKALIFHRLCHPLCLESSINLYSLIKD
ncbi:hypothetical protein YC2023_026207 [Brassica napus]